MTSKKKTNGQKMGYDKYDYENNKSKPPFPL